eukprot:sb/3470816/
MVSRPRDQEVTQYTIQPPLISYGGDDLLTMEQLSGYVFVRSQNQVQWRRRWLELIFTKLFFYEADDDVQPLGFLDMLHLQVSDTRFEDQVSANYAFKIISKTFSLVVATETSYSLKRTFHLDRALHQNGPLGDLKGTSGNYPGPGGKSWAFTSFSTQVLGSSQRSPLGHPTGRFGGGLGRGGTSFRDTVYSENDQF